MTTPGLLAQATELTKMSAEIRTMRSARHDAARLGQRLDELRSALLTLRRAVDTFLACRAIDNDPRLSILDLSALSRAASDFRRAAEANTEIDDATLTLIGFIGAARDRLKASVASWWGTWASQRVSEAGTEIIDLLEPNDQTRARELAERLRSAAAVAPTMPADITSFRLNLKALSDVTLDTDVAELPPRVHSLLRDIGGRNLRLSELTWEDLTALQQLGYAEKLSITWNVRHV